MIGLVTGSSTLVFAASRIADGLRTTLFRFDKMPGALLTFNKLGLLPVEALRGAYGMLCNVSVEFMHVLQALEK